MFGLFKDHKGTTETATEISVDSACFTDKWAGLSVLNLYSKIMHECADRTAIPDGVTRDALTGTFYDSYSPAKKGLVAIVVYAMANKSHLFYKKIKLSDGSFVFEKATEKEATERTGEVGAEYLELDFRGFYEADILTLLYSLLSDVNQALANGVAVSKAMILKIHALSDMIENSQNLEPLQKQLAQLQGSLTGGSMGYIDAKSTIDNVKFDSKASTETSGYVHSMISGVTGIPASYLFSDVVGGLGDMSNSEERRLNVAMKRYFNSILRGVLYSVFDQRFEYKMIIVDVDAMISFFSWLETTALLTDEAKAVAMVNNTVFDRDDINL